MRSPRVRRRPEKRTRPGAGEPGAGGANRAGRRHAHRDATGCRECASGSAEDQPIRAARAGGDLELEAPATVGDRGALGSGARAALAKRRGRDDRLAGQRLPGGERQAAAQGGASAERDPHATGADLAEATADLRARGREAGRIALGDDCPQRRAASRGCRPSTRCRGPSSRGACRWRTSTLSGRNGSFPLLRTSTAVEATPDAASLTLSTIALAARAIEGRGRRRAVHQQLALDPARIARGVQGYEAECVCPVGDALAGESLAGNRRPARHGASDVTGETALADRAPVDLQPGELDAAVVRRIDRDGVPGLTPAGSEQRAGRRRPRSGVVLEPDGRALEVQERERVARAVVRVASDERGAVGSIAAAEHAELEPVTAPVRERPSTRRRSPASRVWHGFGQIPTPG